MSLKTNVDSRLPVVKETSANFGEISSYEEAERHFSGASPAQKMSAEQQFNWLLSLENLDEQVKRQPNLITDLDLNPP